MRTPLLPCLFIYLPSLLALTERRYIDKNEATLVAQMWSRDSVIGPIQDAQITCNFTNPTEGTVNVAWLVIKDSDQDKVGKVDAKGVS